MEIAERVDGIEGTVPVEITSLPLPRRTFRKPGLFLVGHALPERRHRNGVHRSTFATLQIETQTPITACGFYRFGSTLARERDVHLFERLRSLKDR